MRWVYMFFMFFFVFCFDFKSLKLPSVFFCFNKLACSALPLHNSFKYTERLKEHKRVSR